LGIEEIAGEQAKSENKLSQVMEVMGVNGFSQSPGLQGYWGKKIQSGQRSVKTGHEIIGPEESAGPVGIQRHDQIKGQEAEDKSVSDS
jgi:hypothetical protein